jgi:hypothetical protein
MEGGAGLRDHRRGPGTPPSTPAHLPPPRASDTAPLADRRGSSLVRIGNLYGDEAVERWHGRRDGGNEPCECIPVKDATGKASAATGRARLLKEVRATVEETAFHAILLVHGTRSEACAGVLQELRISASSRRPLEGIHQSGQPRTTSPGLSTDKAILCAAVWRQVFCRHRRALVGRVGRRFRPLDNAGAMPRHFLTL